MNNNEKQIDFLAMAAYHEAGHVVASYLLKKNIKSVVIREDTNDRAIGETKVNSHRYHRYRCYKKYLFDEYEKLRKHIEKEMIITVAGQVTEFMEFNDMPIPSEEELETMGRCDREGKYKAYFSYMNGLSDDQNIFNSLFNILSRPPDKYEMHDYWNFYILYCLTMFSFQENWCAVEAIAKALLREPLRKIQSKEIRIIIKGAQQKYWEDNKHLNEYEQDMSKDMVK